MAHAWRKLHELWVHHQSTIGEQALKLFSMLYDVERTWRSEPVQAPLVALESLACSQAFYVCLKTPHSLDFAVPVAIALLA